MWGDLLKFDYCSDLNGSNVSAGAFHECIEGRGIADSSEARFKRATHRTKRGNHETVNNLRRAIVGLRLHDATNGSTYRACGVGQPADDGNQPKAGKNGRAYAQRRQTADQRGRVVSRRRG